MQQLHSFAQRRIAACSCGLRHPQPTRASVTRSNPQQPAARGNESTRFVAKPAKQLVFDASEKFHIARLRGTLRFGMATEPTSTNVRPSSGKSRWSTRFAKVLAWGLAFVGMLPVLLTLLVRLPVVRERVSLEAGKLVRGLGVDARFSLLVHLWPLSVDLVDVRVESTDGKGPALVAPRATVRPKLFALLSGKLVLDQIELVSPRIRIDIQGSRIANLGIKLPKSEGKTESGPFNAPFNLVSVSNAQIDATYNKDHVELFGIDGDLSASAKHQGDGSILEGALRANRAAVRRVREREGNSDAIDEDEVCGIDARFKFDPPRSILVRRLSAHGALDLDASADTFPGCNLSETDTRKLDVELGHLKIDLPPPGEEIPRLSGHVSVRAPIGAVMRVPNTPSLGGWVSLDAEVRYSNQNKLPEADGKIRVQGIRIEQYAFADDIESTFAIHKDIVTSSETKLVVAKGHAVLSNIAVEPFTKGVPFKGSLVAKDASFEQLMKELDVSAHPHVGWDLVSVQVPLMQGTLNPLKLEGDLSAQTNNFAVYDTAISNPNKQRLVGVQSAALTGKVSITPDALVFANMHANLPRTVIDGAYVSIGFHDQLRVDVPTAKINLEDISPVASMKISGQADALVHVNGLMGDPDLIGDVVIRNFVLGDIPFGNITSGKAHLRGQVLDLANIKAQKGVSNYELSSARVDFGGNANMAFEGEVTTNDFSIRDFLALWKMEEDPRFLELDGQLQTNAQIRVILGGPEDQCGKGLIQATAKATAHKLNLFGEHFDDAHFDFDYRWLDRDAGIDGADINVRSFALHKVHRPGKAVAGSVLGSAIIARGGSLRGSAVFDSLSLSKLDRLQSAQELISGSVSGVATISGSIAAYTVTGNADITPVRINGIPYGSSEAHFVMTQASHEGQQLGTTRCGGAIRGAFSRETYAKEQALSQGEYAVDGSLLGGQVILDGFTMTREDKPEFHGRVGLRKLDVGALKRVIAPADDIDNWDEDSNREIIGGAVSGDINIDEFSSKNPQGARISFSPSVVTLSASGQKLDLAPGNVSIVLQNDAISITPMNFKLLAAAGLSGAFQLGGKVSNVSESPTLDLLAQITPVDLAILPAFFPKLSRAGGTLSGSMRITGSPKHPDLDGSIKLRKGEFVSAGIPGISDLNVDLAASESELKVNWATGHFAGGDVIVTGRMPLKGASAGLVEAAFTGRDLHLSTGAGIQAVLDCDLGIAGNAFSGQKTKRMPRITGTVSLASLDYTKPIALDPTQGLQDLAGRARRTAVESYDPSLDSVAFDVTVKSKNPIRVKNNLAEFLLTIEGNGLNVTGTNQRYGFRGALNAQAGGRMSFLANEFEIRKATIKFDDPTRIAPIVDAVAVTEYKRYTSAASASGAGAARATGAWRIALHAYGPAEDLKLEMSSEPSLSQEDITLLLTIGLTKAETDQLGANALSVLAYEAAGTATGADRAVKKYIPVDDFRFGSAYSPRTGRSEPNFTVGKRLTQDISANITSGVSEDRQIRTSVEWRLSGQTGLRASYDNVNNLGAGGIGNLGVGFRWRLEFE
jgi:translocation and assembly module TamB